MEHGIETLNKPIKGDILIYDKDGYKNMNFKGLLSDLYNSIAELEKRLAEAEETIEDLKIQIKYLKGE